MFFVYPLELLLNISYKSGEVIMNSSSFCLSGDVIVSYSYSRNNFTRCRILA